MWLRIVNAAAAVLDSSGAPELKARNCGEALTKLANGAGVQLQATKVGSAG
jgi:hypothetical protein